MVLLPSRSAEHFEAFRSVSNWTKRPAVVSLLPLDAFCCGLLRLVAVAPIPHHNRGIDKDIDRRLNPSTPICSLKACRHTER